MKKVITTLVLSIVILFSWSTVVANATSSSDFTGRYTDTDRYIEDIGTPAIAGALEISVSNRDFPWSAGESLDNASFVVKPCGSVTKSYYNDMQSAIFVVEINPNIVYFVSNGKATVNGENAEITQLSENLYEVKYDCCRLGTPAVGGTLEINLPNWAFGDPLNKESFEVYPCGKVIRSYYNDMQSAIFVVEIDPNIVYFASNGEATVNGEKATLTQVSDNLYEVALSSEKADYSVKNLKIIPNGMNFICKITAIDEKGNVLSTEVINVTGDEAIVRSFPSEVNSIVIQEVVPNESYSIGELPEIEVQLYEGLDIIFDINNDTITYEQSNIYAKIQQIIMLISELFCKVQKILGK